MTMKSHFSRFSLAAAALGASAALLVGCGGSTVTSDEVASESTEVPRESAPDAPGTEGSAEAPAGPGDSSPVDAPDQEAPALAAPEPAPSPAPQDQGAREISEIPESAPERSAEDEEYLDSFRVAEVDLGGLEDTLLGTASTVCSSGQSGEVMATAVAGQLIEQGRTDLNIDELSGLIVDNARATYCP